MKGNYFNGGLTTTECSSQSTVTVLKVKMFTSVSICIGCQKNNLA